MITRTLVLILGGLVLCGVCGCASGYTSISREADGKYVLTGHVLFLSVNGFVDVGTYDAKTKTLTVKETVLH